MYSISFFPEVHLLVPMVLTVLIEVPLFFLLGYRSPKLLLLFALTNCLSNLLLNEFLEQCSYQSVLDGVVLIAEAVVVLLEYVLMSYADKGGWKLFFTVLCTNATSYLTGVFLFA